MKRFKMKGKLKRLFISIGFTALLLVIFAFMQSKEYRSDPETDGYIPNEVTAIKIAEAIWLPIYGKEIYDYKPFKAELIGGKIWRVYGTVHTDFGGSPIAEIQKSDCKVIKVIHEK